MLNNVSQQAVATLTSVSNSVAVNAALSNNFNHTLTQNTTLANPTNIVAGTTYTFNITQASTPYTLGYSSNYKIPNGAPVINTVPGSITTLNFYAPNTSELILTNVTSSQANWDMLTGINQTPLKTLNNPDIICGNGVLIAALTTNNIVVVYATNTPNLVAIILTVDTLGRIISPVPAPTTLDTSITSAVLFSLSVLTSTQCVVSYSKTVSAVACQNVVAFSVSGTTITVGTPVQIRSTEVTSGMSAVCALDGTDFTIVFRTNTSHIMYCYQGSISANAITMGGSPLTIETGLAIATCEVALQPIDATDVMMMYKTNATGVSGHLSAAVITFSGGNPSALGTPLSITTSVAATIAATPFALAQISPNNWVIAWVDTVSTAVIKAATLNNASGTLTAGSAFTFPLPITTTQPFSVAVLCPDSMHVLILYERNGSGTEMLADLLLITGTTLSFITSVCVYYPFVGSGSNFVQELSMCAPSPGSVFISLIDGASDQFYIRNLRP